MKKNIKWFLIFATSIVILVIILKISSCSAVTTETRNMESLDFEGEMTKISEFITYEVTYQSSELRLKPEDKLHRFSGKDLDFFYTGKIQLGYDAKDIKFDKPNHEKREVVVYLPKEPKVLGHEIIKREIVTDDDGLFDKLNKMGDREKLESEEQKKQEAKALKEYSDKAREQLKEIIENHFSQFSHYPFTFQIQN